MAPTPDLEAGPEPGPEPPLPPPRWRVYLGGYLGIFRDWRANKVILALWAVSLLAVVYSAATAMGARDSLRDLRNTVQTGPFQRR